MASPELTLTTDSPLTQPVDIVVVGARKSPDGPVLVAHEAYADLVAALSPVAVTGARDQLVRVVDTVGSATAIAIIGLGESVDAASLRAAAGSAARQLTGLDSIAFAFGRDESEEVLAIAEGALLGAYSFTEFRGVSQRPASRRAGALTVHASSEPASEDLERVRATAAAVRLVRDLVNTPAAELYPQSFAEQARALAGELGVSVTEWDENALADEGFGGILGVGKGSERQPRLVKLEYAPAQAAQHLALVGKGITFDTGGLSLKPMVGMIGMKSDMAGAAVCLAVTLAAARLSLPVRITAWLCLAENMPSGSAMRPNDVLRMRGGRTVEVVNTDAEGRLVLGDGLAAASEEQPDAIIDVATLTGAQVVALGHRYSAVMGDDALVQRVLGAASEVAEPFWPMPLPDELLPRLDSDVADLKNATPGDTAAGMLLAGVFLREFVGTRADGTAIPWAHLDIAGSALLDGKPYGHLGAGATGVAVRTVLRLAESAGAQ
ncbi:leucyl aminopeptidase [Rathayibacter sp. YIM 133350]|uniref:leucyl aminopeptidase n=1 Tax=Rathayibacter sp. YIM 133350 TaxID=3131992 RepID=UPI00307E0AA7